MISSEQKQEVNDLKSRVTAEQLAYWLEQELGEKVSRTGKDWRVGKGKDGSIVISDTPNGPVVDEKNCGNPKVKPGDVFTVIQSVTGAEFPAAMQIARDIAGIPTEPKKQPPTRTKEDVKKDYDSFIEKEWDKLVEGLSSHECAKLMRDRGLDEWKIQTAPNVGYAKESTLLYTLPDGKKGYIKSNSLVFRDGKQIKAIPFKPDGHRLKTALQIPGGGNCYWMPFEKLPESEPVILCEGELDAFALYSCANIAAIPCKPEAAGKDIIKSLAGRCILGYDNDEAGAGETEKARTIIQNAIDISDLWPKGGDPNDYVENGRKNYAPIHDLIMDHIETKKAEQAKQAARPEQAEQAEQLAQKKKRQTAREIARAFCVGYQYDVFKRVFVAPNGEATTLDAAAALCSRQNIDYVSLNCAVEAFITHVKENPATQFDGYERRVKELASQYTKADADTLAKYADRCGYDDYERRRLQLWLYQICGRALKRGEKTDCMLVLAGQTEGLRKTMFFNAISRVLTGADAAEYRFDGSKDSDLMLATSAVCVVDEIDKTLRKTDVAELKAKITQTQSYLRAPYDRDAKTRLNAAVFGATTNDERPIPAGENEARRYWVLRVTRSVGFENTGEVESIMRAAAHDVLIALNANADQYDALTTKGKIWVQTQDEENETAMRNRRTKSADAATISVCAGVLALLQAPTNNSMRDRLYSADIWAAVFETANPKPIDMIGQWEPVKCKAADVSKVIRARCRSKVTTYNGRSVRGFSLAQIESEFMENTATVSDETGLHVI